MNQLCCMVYHVPFPLLWLLAFRMLSLYCCASCDCYYKNKIVINFSQRVIMATLCSRCRHIFILWFLLSSFLSLPNLSSRRLDVYHTSTPGVALVQIQNAGLKSTARGSLKIQDTKIAKNLPYGHHRTTLSGYVYIVQSTNTKILSSHFFAISILNPNYDVINDVILQKLLQSDVVFTIGQLRGFHGAWWSPFFSISYSFRVMTSSMTS